MITQDLNILVHFDVLVCCEAVVAAGLLSGKL